MEERLQKVLARAGIASRRAAEELIRQGRVSVDGRIVTTVGCKVDPDKQQIAFNGKPVQISAKKIYILLNKPKGYVTTLKDPQGRPIVTALLEGITERVFPVGRLDLDTEGALLLTNDGDLAQRIIHPRYEVNKTYIAEVAGCPPPKKITLLEQGIELDGQKTWPATMRVLKKKSSTTIIRVIIHEGKKRQVRKMFAAIGHPVLSLKRVAYGGLSLGRLPIGKYRLLDKNDLDRIFSKKNPLYNK